MKLKYKQTYRCAICEQDYTERNAIESVYKHIIKEHGIIDILYFMKQHNLGITQIRRPIK